MKLEEIVWLEIRNGNAIFDRTKTGNKLKMTNVLQITTLSFPFLFYFETKLYSTKLSPAVKDCSKMCAAKMFLGETTAKWLFKILKSAGTLIEKFHAKLSKSETIDLARKHVEKRYVDKRRANYCLLQQ